MTNMETGADSAAATAAAADIRQNPYKADFPLLATKPEIAFLDSGATAQRPACVLDAQRRFYETMNANPLRGLYSLSVEATEAIADVRAQVARLLGAVDERGRTQASDVIFTRNASESLNLVAKSFAPCVLEPQAMFGLNSSFSHTYTAETNVQVVSIDKRYVMHTLWKYDIFRINLMNIMCSRAQRQRNYLWRPLPDGLTARIIDFIERRCEIPTGYKSLKIKMEELARNIHETRLNVSKTLNRWESLELIELKRGEIIIFDLDILRHEVL